MRTRTIILTLLFLSICTFSIAETVVLENGRVVEGHIYEVTEDYIKIYSEGELLKLRFRNMSIDSAERYRYYNPEPFDLSSVEIKKPEVAPPPKTFSQYVREGLAFAEKGEYEKAIVEFDEAIEIRNDVWDIYLFRAGTYQEMGNFTKALENYDTFLKRNPDNAEVFAKRGWLYQSHGDLNRAIDDYSRVLELDPYNSEILMERYNLYKKTKQWWLASKDIDLLVLFNPEEGEAYVDQALLYYRVGSYYKAWKSVYEAGKRKVKVSEDFIEALREKMKDPFLSKKPEDKKITENIRELIVNNSGFLIIAIISLVLGLVVMRLPAKKMIVTDALDKAIEEEDMMLQMVSFRRASLAKRMSAGMIDLFVLSAFSWAIQLMAPMDIFAGVLAILVALRDSFGGSSIGKSMVGLRVIDEHGYPGVFLQGFIRNFTLALPVLVFYALFWGANFKLTIVGYIAIGGVLFFYLLEGIFVILSKSSGRRIGDRMAGTFVHDLYPERWRWPFAVVFVLVAAGYGAGTFILNKTFHKSFLHQLNFLRYYNIEREFSFQISKGWKLSSEGEGGVVFEQGDLQGSMVMVFNEDVSLYPLALCVTAFTESLKESGLVMRINQEITLDGRDAFRVGFMEKDTGTALMLIYFKKEEQGELYIIQISTPVQNMSRVNEEAMMMVGSLRFE